MTSVNEVRYGQLWADKDAREVRDGRRQSLRVIGIDRFGAAPYLVHLNNEDTGVDSWVQLQRLIRRFRLVEEGPR